MLYILNYAFSPHTAVGNRLMGYFKAMDEMGIDATVYILMNKRKDCQMDYQFKHLKIIFMLDGMPFCHKYLRPIYYKWFVWKIKHQLKPGDKVYTYGFNKLSVLGLKVSGVDCYAERTEHPDVITKISRLNAIKKEKELYLLEQLTGLFVISSSLRDYFISKGIKSSRIHIINMIVDSSRFEGLVKQQVKERYIAYCGTVSNNKDGVDELIKAFALVVAKIPDVYLYIAGNIPSCLEETGNFALIDTLGIKERIKFLGFIPTSEMPQMLKNAEVVVLDRPNNLQAKYGFPTKLGEYLLSENPVVVTKVGDIHLFLKDGETALLSDPCNPEEFASKVIWALEHPKEASEIGKRGAEVAMLEFNSRIETRKMIDVILKKTSFQ